MKRTLIAVYGLVAYALFFATFLYGCGFIGGFLTPTRLDAEARGEYAILIDLALLSLFALQHSGMARPAFKRWLTRWIPSEMERSTYVLVSSLVLALLFWQWQPLGGTLWRVESPIAVWAIHTVFVASVVLILISTFAISHFDLFGLRQTWFAWRGEPYRPLPFRVPMLYRIVRHPLYVGWIGLFWATPHMTVSHLVFSAGCTLYILAAIGLEERDLVAVHPEYARYREQVPMLLPRFKAHPKAETLHDTV